MAILAITGHTVRRASPQDAMSLCQILGSNLVFSSGYISDYFNHSLAFAFIVIPIE